MNKHKTISTRLSTTLLMCLPGLSLISQPFSAKAADGPPPTLQRTLTNIVEAINDCKNIPIVGEDHMDYRARILDGRLEITETETDHVKKEILETVRIYLIDLSKCDPQKTKSSSRRVCIYTMDGGKVVDVTLQPAPGIRIVGDKENSYCLTTKSNEGAALLADLIKQAIQLKSGRPATPPNP